LSRGGRLRIEVSDNGPGVPEALAAHIFTPFFSTKNRAGESDWRWYAIWCTPTAAPCVMRAQSAPARVYPDVLARTISTCMMPSSSYGSVTVWKP
jgi:hypothetical protein